MRQQTKLIIALVLLLAAGLAYVLLSPGGRRPGTGQPAEIIDPDTRARTATTWDKIWPMKPIQNPLNGYWLVPLKGDKWAYVVPPGVADPTPAPAATGAR